MSTYTLDLNDKNYSSKVLSYYLWGQESPPSPSEIANESWINRTESVTLKINPEQFSQIYGHLFNAKDFKLTNVFFSGKTSTGDLIDKNHKDLTLNENGEYVLTQNQFAEVFYANSPLKDTITDNEKLVAAISLYNRGYDDEDFAKRAFVFGTVYATLDIESVRYVLDENLNPLRIENFNIMVHDQDFDFKGGSGSDFVNDILGKISDPSGIGRTVYFDFGDEAKISSQSISISEYNNLIKLSEGDIFDDVTKYIDFAKEFYSIRDAGIIDFLNQNNKLVVYGTNKSDSLIGTKALNFDLNGEPNQNASIINHYKDSIGNGIVYVSGGGNDVISGTNNDDVIIAGDNDDILSGGNGKDILNGGNGIDIYNSDKEDLILDDDGNGIIFLDGQQISGGTRTEDEPENIYHGDGNEYVLNGSTLIINGGLRIENYSKDQLGIHLDIKEEEEEEEEDEKPDFALAENKTSPLVIDLDGDGVETTSINDVYFDHNNDGLREKTAWVKSDDGLLVLDKNNDGIISNGNELFGSNTTLKNGLSASNGFEALSDYDDNADGVIDSNDALYSSIKIWQDIDENGKTDSGELKSLEQVGIKSIKTTYTSTSLTDAQGNFHQQTSIASLSNQQETTVTDVWFNVDTTTRKNDTNIEYSIGITSMPNAKGFGKVHDLWQAMVLDPDLKSYVDEYMDATDPVEKNSKLDALIYRWTGSDSIDPYSRDPKKIYGHVMDARQLVTLEKLVGRSYLGTWCWEERDPNPHGQAAPLLIDEYLRFKRFTAAQILAQTKYSNELDFIHSNFSSDSQRIVVDWVELESRLNSLFTDGNLTKLTDIISILNGLGSYSPSYRNEKDQIFNSIYASNVNLAPFLDFSVQFGTSNDDYMTGISTGTIFFGLEGDDRLYGQSSNDVYHYGINNGNDVILDHGGVDKIVFEQGIFSKNLSFTRNITTVWIKIKDESSNIIGSLQIDNFFNFDGSTYTGAIEQIIFSDKTYLNQEQILSLLISQSTTNGDDLIFGTAQNDMISGLTGNDSIHGLNGNDQILGSTGRDELLGDDGNDQLIGGEDNDSLIGGTGSDDYIFSVSNGHDIINNYSSDFKTTTDRIVFDASVIKNNVSLKRIDDDLIVQIGIDDSIQVSSFFVNKANDGYAIDHIVFSDGTIWGIDIIKEKVIQSTSGDDLIQGYESNDVISGMSGNDILYGNSGNDMLSGNDGYDTLFGDDGDDSLRADASVFIL